jgi:hypothetical protein
MKVIKVDYDHTYDLLNEIMDGKTAYDKVIGEKLMKVKKNIKQSC